MCSLTFTLDYFLLTVTKTKCILMQTGVSFIDGELQQDYLQVQRSLTWIKIWWISDSTGKMTKILLQTQSRYVFLLLIQASLLLCCSSLINWKHIIIIESFDGTGEETCFLVINLQSQQKKTQTSFVQEKQPPPATLFHWSTNIYISFVN